LAGDTGFVLSLKIACGSGDFLESRHRSPSKEIPEKASELHITAQAPKGPWKFNSMGCRDELSITEWTVSRISH